MLISLIILTASCDQEHNDHTQAQEHHEAQDANDHMHQHTFEDLVKRFEGPERDAYQQPEKVLELLGDLEGKTVMDIGAGTGYFSFRLVEAGAKVIAADVDERFQEYMDKKRIEQGIPEELLELRQVPYDSPSLTTQEVDMVLIVNTYHHIESRPAYFRQVLTGLNAEGLLVVIDFKKEDSDFGPPKSMRLDDEEVAVELQKAGFKTFDIDTTTLAHQYIIRAKR